MRIFIALFFACQLIVVPDGGAVEPKKAFSPFPDGYYSSTAGAAFGQSYVNLHFSNPSLYVGLPEWNDEESEPPLSVREAIVIAERTIKDVVEVPENYSHYLRSATLRYFQRPSIPDGVWYWQVAFDWWTPEELQESSPRMRRRTPMPSVRVVVLMNGEVNFQKRVERPDDGQ